MDHSRWKKLMDDDQDGGWVNVSSGTVSPGWSQTKGHKTAVVVLVLLWPPYGIEQAIIFSSCRLFFFSSPNLSSRRLDVCHTSTHGVGLVQI